MQPDVDCFPIAAHPVMFYTTAIWQHLLFFVTKDNRFLHVTWLYLCLVLWNVLETSSYYYLIITSSFSLS